MPLTQYGPQKNRSKPSGSKNNARYRLLHFLTLQSLLIIFNNFLSVRFCFCCSAICLVIISFHKSGRVHQFIHEEAGCKFQYWSRIGKSHEWTESRRTKKKQKQQRKREEDFETWIVVLLGSRDLPEPLRTVGSLRCFYALIWVGREVCLIIFVR